ncbi:hypothetical protein [Halomontanus rarus]|uniref:hypothetical protein n=1 Tax=Halomontanus rarus TaxID=3034020 RepID=UPI0023E867C2|nr:hypothetical protein [Halovivax sp. TS33]
MSTIDRLDVDLRDRFDTTRAATALVFRRFDSAGIVLVLTVGYLGVFLWIVGDLSIRPAVPANVLIVDDPVARMFDRTGPASFEAIALLDTGFVRVLVSPVNVAIGLLVAVLVAVNLALTYLAVVQPAACGIGAGSGLLASLPALFSGTVCCGPVILIAFGIQASALLLTLFAWLLPIGIAMLLVSLVSVAGKIDVTEPSV